MRPRLRRLVSWWRGIAPASRAALPPPQTPSPQNPDPQGDSRDDTARRLEDAQQRLKQSVPPREDS